MIELYDFQKKAIDNVIKSLPLHNKIAVDSPVSSGKSIMIAKLAIELEHKVLISLSISSLIDQMVDTFKMLDFYDYTVLKSGHEMLYDSSKRICISMDNTVHARKDSLPLKQYKYIIADEIHIRADGSRFTDICLSVNPKNIIGFSGTCYGSDLMTLNGFNNTIKTISINELIRQGKLSHVNVIVPGWTTRIKISNKLGSSELTKDDLVNQMNTEYRNMVLNTFLESRNIIDPYDAKGVWYCSHVDEAKEYAKILQEAGIAAFAYHGSLDKTFRKNLMKSFLNRGVLHIDKDIHLFNFNEPVEKIVPLVLVSVSTLTIGFSDTTLNYIVETNSTSSKSKSDQILGRVHRKDDLIKDKYLFDFGRNIERLGFTTDEFEPVKQGSTRKEAVENLRRFSMPYLEVLCKNDDELYCISREWYEDRIKKITEDIRPMSELTIDEKIDKLIVCEDIEELVLVYTSLFKDIHGNGYTYLKWDSSINQQVEAEVKPFYNDSTIHWIAKDWIENISIFPEFKDKFIKSFKTKARSLLKNKGNIFSIKFFIKWLVQNEIDKLNPNHNYYYHPATDSGVIFVYPCKDEELEMASYEEYLKFIDNKRCVSMIAIDNIKDAVNEKNEMEDFIDGRQNEVDIMRANIIEIDEEELPF